MVFAKWLFIIIISCHHHHHIMSSSSSLLNSPFSPLTFFSPLISCYLSHPYAFMSPCHLVILSSCHIVTLSPFHHVILPDFLLCSHVVSNIWNVEDNKANSLTCNIYFLYVCGSIQEPNCELWFWQSGRHIIELEHFFVRHQYCRSSTQLASTWTVHCQDRARRSGSTACTSARDCRWWGPPLSQSSATARPLASTCSLVEPGLSWSHACRDFFAGLGGAGVFFPGAVRHSWDFIKNEILLLAVDQHLHQIQQMEWQILQIVGAKTDDVSRLRK